MTQDERDDDAVGAALRRDAGEARFRTGFEDRVMCTVSTGRDDGAAFAGALALSFRRIVAPAALAASVIAGIVNVAATRNTSESAIDHILGVQPESSPAVDLFSLYTQ